MLGANALVRPSAVAWATRDTTARARPEPPMTPAEMDRVFGAGRLQVATGAHVEVIREAVAHGVERRYTKRFLAGPSGDLRPWTEREWRILQRLDHQRAPVAKPLELLVPDERGALALQTRDAGATVEQWATLVPLRRGDTPLRNVFEDCAHWWSLVRHCLLALDAVHSLGFVHLELKADNVCIPWAPAGAGRPLLGQPLRPRFKGLALIDVAFSLLPEVDYVRPLPLLRQPAYDYQSPRLLHALEEGRRGNLGPARALDWRCDFFSLAGMLWRYLPELDEVPVSGWTTERHLQASELVQHLLDLHGAAMPAHWPHRELIAYATERLLDRELAAALDAGTSFDPERQAPLAAVATPATRLAEPALSSLPPSPPSTPLTPVEPEGAGASASPPLAAAPGEGDAAKSAASAPAPLPGAGPEPKASEPAEGDAGEKAPVRLTWRATRKAARRRLVLRLASAVVLVGAGVAAWWFSGEQEARVEMPSLADLADRSLPASAAALARAPAAAAVTASAVAPRAETTPESPRVDAAAAAAANDELAARAEAWRRDQLPAVAVAAERHLEPVLAVAAESAEFRRRGNIRAAARAMRAATPATPPEAKRDEQARTLNDAAWVAYGRSSDVAEALALQTQAFGANPLDSEVAGNLAFLYLRERPPQAEAARRFALHALTLNDARFPSGRTEDWTTFAIASALTGHDSAARNAWFVALALTADLQRLCKAAVAAEAAHGEPLHPSVQALLQRVRSSAAYGRCEAAAPEPTRRTKAPDKPAPRPRRPIP